MDGRPREYSLERSRLFSAAAAAGLVMTPTYLEPPSAGGLLRAMPELSRPAASLPSPSLATSYPQYHGRCSSSMSVTSGTNFSFLSGMLGSMPSPAASPFRAAPGVPNIRHFWPPVPSTPDDYERRLPCQYPLMSSCSQFCRCQQQAPLGYGRCAFHSGLYSLLPVAPSPCYSQPPRVPSSSAYHHPLLDPTTKDLMFPSGIQLGAMIPPSQQHVANASPTTPALDLERHSLDYFAKGLETPTCCVGTELWTDNRLNSNRNSDTNNNSTKKRDVPWRQHERAKGSHEAASKESSRAAKTSEKCKENSQPSKGATPPPDKVKDEYQQAELACQKRSPPPPKPGDKLAVLPEKAATPPSKVNGETVLPNGNVSSAKARLSCMAYKDRRRKDKAREKRYDKVALAVKGAPSDKWGVATLAAVTITTVTVTTTTLTQSNSTTSTSTATGKAALKVHPHENSSLPRVSPGGLPQNVAPTVPPNSRLTSSGCNQQLKENHAYSPSSRPSVTPPNSSITSSHVLQCTSQLGVSNTSHVASDIICGSPPQNGMRYSSAVVSDANKTWQAVHAAQCVGDRDISQKKSSIYPTHCLEAPVIKKENKYETTCGKWKNERTDQEITNVPVHDLDKVHSISGERNCSPCASDFWKKSEMQHFPQASALCPRPRTQHSSRRRKEGNDSANSVKLRNAPCAKASAQKNEAKVAINFQCHSTNQDYERPQLQDLTSKSRVVNQPTHSALPPSPMALTTKNDPSSTAVISIHNGVVPSQAHSDTAAALHPQYVFDWQSPQPQYSPATVTTIPAQSGYLIQPPSQSLPPDQSLPSSISENTSRHASIIVQTVPKTVIAAMDHSPPNALLDSNRIHNPAVRITATSNSCTDVRETSAVAQIMPVPLVTESTIDKIASNAQEQTTEGSVLVHNPTVSLNIPVGIAVARQRQEHNSSHVKRSDDVAGTDVIRNASPASCLRSTFLRESRELQKQPSVADYSSNLILTSGSGPTAGQWDEPTRPAVSLPPPWATTTSHSPAYWLPQGHYAAATAPLPIQINPMDPAHLPIPPVGYQLARDSITGHLLLIPTNLDIMERSTVWSTYATSTPHIQPSHQLQQLMVQQQIIQQDQHRSLEYRLALPQQFPGGDCIKTQVSGVHTTDNTEEISDNQSDPNCDTANQVNAGLEKTVEKETVAVSLSTTTAPAPTQSILASIPIATGQPFSYTFPTTSTLPYFYEATSVVQLAQAVQTETGRRSQGTSPVPMDECLIITPVEHSAQTLDDSDTCESSRTGNEFVVTRDEPQVADASNQTETPPLTEEEEDSVDMEVNSKEDEPSSESDKVIELIDEKEGVVTASEKHIDDCPLLSATQDDIAKPQEEIIEPEYTDFHGLELLSYSIEKYEECHSNKIHVLGSGASTGIDNVVADNAQSEPSSSSIQELVNTLELAVSIESPTKTLPQKGETLSFVTKSQITEHSGNPSVPECVKEFSGLGLLCALAEQRFIEENWTVENEMVITRSKSKKSEEKECTTSDPLPDINRSYRNAKSQKEFQNFIATKISQYSCSSPGHRSPAPGEGPMDAAELEMRMRLAELQRRYKQKQRELAKLQPKKEKEEVEKSPAKRGPGRPRKRRYSGPKKFIRPTLNSLVKALVKLDSPPHALHTSMDEPVRKKKKKSRDSDSNTNLAKFSPIVKTSDPITPKKPILKPSVLKANQLSPSAFTQLSIAARKLDTFSTKQHVLFSSSTHQSHLPKLEPSIKNLCAIGATTVKVHIVNMSAEKISKTLNASGTTNSLTQESGISDVGSKSLTPPKLTIPIQFSNIEDSTKTPEKRRKVCKEGIQETRPGTPNGTSVMLGNHLHGFDDTTGLGLLAKFATQVAEESKLNEPEAKNIPDETKSEIKLSVIDPPLPNKRKPGRPKKHSQSKTKDATEMIVAKKPKKMTFFKKTTNDDNDTSKLPSVKQEPTKTTNSSPQKAFYLEDEGWNRRRSERIFLNDLNVTPAGGYSENNRSVLSPPQLKPATEDSPTWKSKTDENLKPPKNLTRAPDVGKAKKKPAKSDTGLSPPPAKKKKREKDRSKRTNDRSVSDELSQALKEKFCLSESTYCGLSPRDSDSDNIESSSTYSEGENMPLSQLVERSITPEPRSCLISPEELIDKMRVLTLMDGLFYAGHINAIQAPDVYGITIDGGRSNRPHIYSREEILKLAFLEVTPGSIRYLPEGTRICAYWSQQYRCLYPGTVAKSTSPNPLQDKTSVYVEFDDGDSGRIPLIDIRLLHQGFPTVSYDPSPLVYQGKRRSRSTADSSCDNKCAASDDSRSACNPKSNKNDETNGSAPSRSSSISNCKSLFSKSTTNESRTLDSKKKSKKSKNESRSNDSTKVKNKDSETKSSRPSSSEDVNKPRKHKKHKDRSEEHRHHHHHHHHKRKHKHERHDKHSVEDREKEKGRDKTPTKSASVVDVSTKAIVKTPLCPTEPNKSELTMRIKTTATDINQSEKTVTKPDNSETATTDTWRSSESDQVNNATEEKLLTDDSDVDQTPNKKSQSKKEDHPRLKKRKERLPSAENKSKIAAFLPARQLWRWSGKSFKRPGTKGRAKKEFYKAITRGRETITVGDCAVFLSTGRPHLPYIGRIEMMWEGWGGNMVVRVKWFYHPEETKGAKKLTNVKGALYQSPHEDENDVQTISHKCEVLSWRDFRKWRDHEISHSSKYGSVYDNNDVYYLAGTYDPTTGVVTMEPGIC